MLVGASKCVNHTEIDAPHGHDAFLIPTQRYIDVFSSVQSGIAQEVSHAH